jgi:hypothetical protein
MAFPAFDVNPTLLLTKMEAEYNANKAAIHLKAIPNDGVTSVA